MPLFFGALRIGEHCSLAPAPKPPAHCCTGTVIALALLPSLSLSRVYPGMGLTCLRLIATL